MKKVIRRPYRSLVDFPAVYQFMLENYSTDWKNGCPAAFFEYASVLFWTDQSQTHRHAIWEEDQMVVAFCFYETRVGEALFNIKDGYETLASEMIAYASERLRDDRGKLVLKLFAAQKAVMQAARDLGYQQHTDTEQEHFYFYEDGPLDFTLPEGFSFEAPGAYDMAKMIAASWRGFDNDGEPDGGAERGYHLIAAPHAMPELDVVIKNAQGEYVCYAGMWMVPENNLAYMEPLCTVPECRRMGLASAALAELYRRTKPLGATHMTGGSHPFYPGIGFRPAFTWTFWEKEKA